MTAPPLIDTDDHLLAALAPHLVAIVMGRSPLAIDAIGGYDHGPSLAAAVARLAAALGLDEDAAEALDERVHELACQRARTLMARAWSDGFGSWNRHTALALPDDTVVVLYSDDSDHRGLIVDVLHGPLDERHAHDLVAAWCRARARAADGDAGLTWGNDVRTALTVRSPMLRAAMANDDELLPVDDDAFWQVDEVDGAGPS